MPNPAEVAQLGVAGVNFQDWESVWVQIRWKDGYPMFRFTAAEYATLPTLWTALQFKPNDFCQIILGGQLAITGVILTRQTSYDANNHVVELSGTSPTYFAANSSIDAKKSNFDNMSMQAIATKAAGDLGANVITVGLVNPKPFPQVQAQPGELLFDFLDKLARQRGAVMGSDHLGNFLLIGDHQSPIVQDLIEGENILKMQCIISIAMTSTEYSTSGQVSNASQVSPMMAALMAAHVPGSLIGVYRSIQTVLEHPASGVDDVMARAYYEQRFREGTVITAYVTVQGWLRDGKNLWRAGDAVYVSSPMAMLDLPMSIQTVTYQQDSASGTTTTLELVLPWLLGSKPYGTTPGDTPTQPGTEPPPADAVVST